MNRLVPFAGAVLGLALLTTACQPSPAAAPAAERPPAAQAAPAREPEARLPEGPAMAARRVPLDERPCRDALGDPASARLVQRCIAVSPATHPPCNAANPCDLIQGEIDRSCALWSRDGQTPPKECAA